jgi:hypothetical protein
MSWLRAIVGTALLLPGVGCTMCCSPFDQCGPLCNGECGCGCCSTTRAGSYSVSQSSYYEDVSPTPAPRLAPTPAAPRQAPTIAPEPPVIQPEDTTPTYTPEIESPLNTAPEESPFDDNGTEPSSPTDTTTNGISEPFDPNASDAIPGDTTEDEPMQFDDGIPNE